MAAVRFWPAGSGGRDGAACGRGKVEVCEVELAEGDRRDEKREVDDRTESRTEPESRLDMAAGCVGAA